MTNFTRILMDQRAELNRKLESETIIKREAFSEAETFLKSNLIKVVTGARRCGKSTFAAQLLKGKSYGYVNFDDEVIASIPTEQLNHVLESMYEVYGKFDYLLLDEIQNIDRWELFVNRLHRSGINIVVTGSNANLLSRELATHLTGRHTVLELSPFSFREFLTYRKIPADIGSTQNIGIIKNNLAVYIENGGFPETLKEEPKTYLKSLYSTVLTKDILVRRKIRYSKTFMELALYCISNFSKEISFNKLKHIFNLGSDHTTKNYLGYLEETYLVFALEKFSYKKKESLLGNRKLYVIDTGLANTIATKFLDNLGRLYENIVAIELLRKEKDAEIYFWQDIHKNEVDFLVKRGLSVEELIQVCYSIDDPDTKKREVRNLVKACREFSLGQGLIITADFEGEETVEGKKIKYVPLWKWLLT